MMGSSEKSVVAPNFLKRCEGVLLLVFFGDVNFIVCGLLEIFTFPFDKLKVDDDVVVEVVVVVDDDGFL